MRLRFLEHLFDHADGLSRSCAPAHITASALIVSPERGEVLLVLHAKAGSWLQTGGHCEPGDPTLAAAALREATEESGIAGLTLTEAPVRLDRHPAPCRRGVVEHHLDVQYLAIAPPGARPTRSAESLGLAWFPFDALPSPSDVQHLVAYASANSAPEAWVTPSRKPRARSARG
jgi:8-oxo-dGTP pyrophosphatase MutT (NUDIX family)